MWHGGTSSGADKHGVTLDQYVLFNTSILAKLYKVLAKVYGQGGKGGSRM